MALKQIIKRERAKLNLSPRELARKADISPEWVYKIESGREKNPKIQQLKKVAKALETNIHALIV